MARCDRPARAYRRSAARTRSESYGMSRAGFLQLSLFEDVQRHAKSGLRTCEPGLRDSQCAQAGRRRWRARGAAGCDGAYVPAHEHERPPVAAERPRRAHSLIVSQSCARHTSGPQPARAFVCRVGARRWRERSGERVGHSVKAWKSRTRLGRARADRRIRGRAARLKLLSVLPSLQRVGRRYYVRACKRFVCVCEEK